MYQVLSVFNTVTPQITCTENDGLVVMTIRLWGSFNNLSHFAVTVTEALVLHPYRSQSVS